MCHQILYIFKRKWLIHLPPKKVLRSKNANLLKLILLVYKSIKLVLNQMIAKFLNEGCVSITFLLLYCCQISYIKATSLKYLYEFYQYYYFVIIIRKIREISFSKKCFNVAYFLFCFKKKLFKFFISFNLTECS